MIVRNDKSLLSILVLIWLLMTACSASGATYSYSVSIGDHDPGFYPASLTINAGDTVTFFDVLETGPHDVIADDESFHSDLLGQFQRTFTSPGIVTYHDGFSGAKGVIVVRRAAEFAIDSGITGAWYDPAQSGHGLFVEILPDNRFYATWFTFNPAGNEQSWFTGVGTYSGNIATITGMQIPAGGRWVPNFDPNHIVRNTWGMLNCVFSDCDHGKVDFNSVAGYGSGSMNLTRLTQPAGLQCAD
jgi:plastocyanin